MCVCAQEKDLLVLVFVARTSQGVIPSCAGHVLLPAYWLHQTQWFLQVECVFSPPLGKVHQNTPPPSLWRRLFPVRLPC